MLKKASLGIVLVIGLFWLVSPLVLGYPGKTAAVDDLTDSFRPVFADDALAQSSKDIATVNAFASQFQAEAVPALSEQLNMTPEAFVAAISDQYPKVGTGLQELPTSLPYFNTLVDGLQGQKENFDKSDSIPTAFLPAKTVTVLFVVLGLAAISIATVGLTNRKRASGMLAVAAVAGVAVIGVTLALSVPAKARAVDNLTNAFRPVFTTQGAQQTRAYLTTLESMSAQLANEALPGLADLLGVTPEQLSTNLSSNFPEVAAGLQEIPAILERFDVLVGKIEANVDVFQKADHIPTDSLETTKLFDQFLYPSIILIIAGGAGYVVSRRDQSSDV